MPGTTTTCNNFTKPRDQCNRPDKDYIGLMNRKNMFFFGLNKLCICTVYTTMAFGTMLNSGWASITVSPWPQAPWFLEDLGMSQHDSPHFGMDKYKTWACLKTYETLSKTIVWADESLQNPSYFSVNMCVCV